MVLSNGGCSEIQRHQNIHVQDILLSPDGEQHQNGFRTVLYVCSECEVKEFITVFYKASEQLFMHCKGSPRFHVRIQVSNNLELQIGLQDRQVSRRS